VPLLSFKERDSVTLGFELKNRKPSQPTPCKK
jgi:hypothetical protein